MVSVTKFSFDTSFDSEKAAKTRQEDEAPPPEPTFSEADVAAARRDGFAEGRETGASEVLNSLENTVAQALTAIADQLSAVGPVITRTLQQGRHEAISIAQAITRKMVAHRDAEAVLPTIESVICGILPRVMDEPRVVIRVSDDALDALQERLPALTERTGFPGSLILLAEQELNGPDCRIEWADGGAEYNAETLWSEIDGMIEQYRAGIESGDDPAGGAEPAAGPGGEEPVNSEEHPDG